MIKLRKISAVILSFCILLSQLSAGAYELVGHDKVNLPGLELPKEPGRSVENGTIIFECEDIVGEKAEATVASDENASGGKAVVFGDMRWNADETPNDDLYVEFSLDESEEAGIYKMWYRCYTTTTKTSSFFFDFNKGSYSASFFSNLTDGKYRWRSAPIELKHGENHLAIRRRASGRIDKIIITNDTTFKPSAMDDEPVYMTEEEMEKYLLGLYPEPEIKPIKGHPRLYLTPEFIPGFKKGITTDEVLKAQYEKYKKYAYDEINCKLDTSLKNNHNATLLAKILGRALVWVIGDETDVNHAKQTITHVTDYLTTVRTPDDSADITRSRGNIILTGAVVYDWLYDVMSEEEKQTLLKLIMKVVGTKELGWPPTGMSSITSHAGEYEIFRDMLGAGVAIYDEYPTLYEVAAGRMFAEMVPARNWLRPNGRFELGHDYAETRSYSELWADMTMQRMGYPSIYEAGSDTIRWLIRTRLSHGSQMPSGDMYSLTRKEHEQYHSSYPLTMCIAGNLYKDPYVKREFERRREVSGGIDVFNAFFALIFTDPSVPTDIGDEWDYSKYTTYPLSGILARTSWQEGYNSDNAMAFLNMQEGYFGDHHNLYTGDFQLYYRGLLAMNTGTYNSSEEHNLAYKRRAIAGNVMLCYDPNEKFVPTWNNVYVPNDGGQRVPYLNENGVSKGHQVMYMTEYELDENGVIGNRDLVVADNVKHFIGPNEHTPEFSYLGGDLTNAYSDKVADYHRSMVFMDLFNDDYPAALVVFDKMTSSDKTFKKTWLLHSEEKPAIDGVTTTITRVQNGFDGKLVNETLLPERSNTKINVVGGDNNEMYILEGKTYTPTAGAIEAGKYRIEISPRAEKTDDVFLNSMYVTSASANLPPLKMYKEQGAGYVGVTVRDRFVTFAKNAELIENGFTVMVRDNGFNEVSVLLTDMAEGVWTVIGNGKTFNVMSENGKNCVYFKGAPGAYKLEKAPEGSVADEISAPEAKKRPIGDFSIWIKSETTSSAGRGRFIYLEHPTILRDGTAYVSVDTLKEFGASVYRTGSDVTLIGTGGTLKLSAGTNEWLFNDAAYYASCQAFEHDGTVYVAIRDVKSLINYNITYSHYAKAILASKIATQE